MAVDALGGNEQVVVLRKGGIREGPGGLAVQPSWLELDQRFSSEGANPELNEALIAQELAQIHAPLERAAAPR